MLSPAPGTTLQSGKVVFTWTTERGAREFHLQAGSQPGGIEFYFGVSTAPTEIVPTLPLDGSTVHVRLYIQHADFSWTGRDYVYTAGGSPLLRSGGRVPGFE